MNKNDELLEKLTSETLRNMVVDLWAELDKRESIEIDCSDVPECPPSHLSEEGKVIGFQKDIERLINLHSLEGMFGDTPDFILAQYLTDCLWNYSRAIERRREWYKVGGLPIMQP